MAVRATVDGGCLCVLVNTVVTAQTIYDRIKATGTDAKLLLFHSRFSAARRQEIENECLMLFGKDHANRPPKAILVATQVVEQSLDIDFDAMITEIAPIDLLLQRCGRLHRHEDTARPAALQRPVLDVLLPANGKFGATEKIYHPLFLNRTTDALNRIERIVIPDDIPRLVNEVYQQDLLGEAETEDWMKQLFDTDMMTGQAERGELLPPQDDGFGLGGHGQLFLEDGEDSFVAAKTRLGEETVRLAVVPPGLYESAKQCMECGTIPKRIAESLMKHSVSASQRSVRKINWGSHLEGTGRVYGMVILPCSDPADGPTQTLKAVTPTHTIILDREYGLILNEGGTKT